MADPHQFFDDTSSAPSRGYGGQPSPGGLGYPTSSPEAAFLADPMSNMAMVYGSSLAAQGKELVDKNVSGLPGGLSAGSPWLTGRRHGASGLTFASPDRPLHPCQQAQVLLRRGHGVRGQEAGAARLSLPSPGERLLSACQGVGEGRATLGCCHCPNSLHRTGRYSTSRTPQWPPALTSMLQTSTFQVVPSHPPGHGWDRCLGAWRPSRASLP